VTETKKCAHLPCECATSESNYCSSYCETAGEIVEAACGCQHAACAVGERPSGSEQIGASLPRDPEDHSADAAPEKREKMLDKTLADSYPASDPSSTIPNPFEDSL
jgi:hypothetical protein